MKRATRTTSATRSHSASAMRWYGAIVSVTGIIFLSFWLPHHSFGPIVPLALFLICAAVACFRTHDWLLLMPALLPVIDLTAWTGHLYITEFDLALAGLLSGLGLRTALRTVVTASPPDAAIKLPVLGIACFSLLFISYAIATWRGLMPLPVLDENVMLGYSSHLNALRVTKGFWCALLVLPFFHHALRQGGQTALHRFIWGLLLGLLLVALSGLWERYLFPGVFDFGSDYRITASFWEMHVGGAALDGFLALTLPFALWWVIRLRSLQAIAFAFPLLALAIYITLVSFSRGLYIALAVQLVMLVMLWHRQRTRTEGPARSPDQTWLPALLVLLVLLGIAALVTVFKASGYRALLAYLGLALLVFLGAPRLAGMRLSQAVIGVAFGSMLALGVIFAADLLSISVYVVYTASWLLTSLLWLLLVFRPVENGVRIFFVAMLLVLAVCIAWVAWYWKNPQAAWHVAGPIALILAIAGLPIARRQTLWSVTPQTVAAAGTATIVLSLFTIMLGNYFMNVRFMDTRKNLHDRMTHWHLSLGFLERTENWIFGIGAGSYPDSYFWRAPANQFPGTLRFNRDNGNGFLTLGGPRHIQGFGEMFRVGQRIPSDMVPPLQLSFSARTAQNAGLHIEICRRHLLYPEGCAAQGIEIKAGPMWQQYSTPLRQNEFDQSAVLHPTVFAMALNGRSMDIDNLSLTDAQGRELLVNGDFSNAFNRWFFFSDKFHLPWHAKNLWLHQLIENGLLGMLSISLLGLAAVRRLTLGGAAAHPAAPTLAAALTGFFVVGLFDSLLDVPRLGFLFFLLCWLSLSLHAPRRTS